MSTGHGADRAVQPIRLQSEFEVTVRRLAQSAIRNNWVRAGAGLWIIGLLIVFVLPAPLATTEAKLSRYEYKMVDVSAAVKNLEEVADEWFDADSDLRAERVSFRGHYRP